MSLGRETRELPSLRSLQTPAYVLSYLQFCEPFYHYFNKSPFSLKRVWVRCLSLTSQRVMPSSIWRLSLSILLYTCKRRHQTLKLAFNKWKVLITENTEPGHCRAQDFFFFFPFHLRWKRSKWLEARERLSQCEKGEKKPSCGNQRGEVSLWVFRDVSQSHQVAQQEIRIIKQMSLVQLATC